MCHWLRDITLSSNVYEHEASFQANFGSAMVTNCQFKYIYSSEQDSSSIYHTIIHLFLVLEENFTTNVVTSTVISM